MQVIVSPLADNAIVNRCDGCNIEKVVKRCDVERKPYCRTISKQKSALILKFEQKKQKKLFQCAFIFNMKPIFISLISLKLTQLIIHKKIYCEILFSKQVFFRKSIVFLFFISVLFYFEKKLFIDILIIQVLKIELLY